MWGRGGSGDVESRRYGYIRAVGGQRGVEDLKDMGVQFYSMTY